MANDLLTSDIEMSTPPKRSPFSSMRHPQYRWLYASNMAFFFAMQGQMIVRSYLAFKLTHSALMLGLVNLAMAIPMLLVSPFGGVIADRVEKRRLIIAGQGILITSEFVIFALLLGGKLEFWHLLAFVFVMGCIFPVIMPARQAIVVNIVGLEGLQNAMALSMGGMNAARVVAPALAGFLIFAVDVKGAYLVSIALYLAGLTTMLKVSQSPPVPRTNKASVFGDMAEGFRFVKNSPPLRTLMLVGLIPPLFAMPFQSLIVVFTEDVWHVESWGLGVLQASAGLGGVVGAFVIAFWGETDRKLRLMIGGVLGFAASLLLFSASPWFLLAIPFVFVADVFASMFQTSNSTVTQLLVPDHVRGRVMSLGMMTFGLTPLGAVPIAAAAQAWGAPIAVGGASIVAAALIGIAYLISPTLRGIDDVVRKAMEEAGPRRGPGAWGAAPPPAKRPPISQPSEVEAQPVAIAGGQ